MTNYTYYNEEFKTRILADYADTEKTCWASDSGKTVAECWCAQCIEGRTLYPIMKEQALDYANAKAYLAKLDEERTKYNKVAELITPLIEDETIDPTSFLGEQLIKLLQIRLTEEIEVTFTVNYTATLTVPKGTDVDDLEVELASQPDVSLNDTIIGEARQDGVEVFRY